MNGAGLRSLWRRRVPLVLQTEAAECGLACLAMVLAWFGVVTDLRSLRQRHTLSLNGITLLALTKVAEAEHLTTRAVRVEPAELAGLRLPCILHWDLSHYVVLTDFDGRTATVQDPALGTRKVPLAELSKRFTGVALELWPAPELKPVDDRTRAPLSRLVGRVSGASGVLVRILGLSLALELFALISPLFMQWITDQVLVARDTHLLGVLAIGFALLLLIEQCVGLGRSWVLANAAASLRLQWRSNVLSHLVSLPNAWFQKRHLGDVLSRFRAVDSIQNVLTAAFVEATLDGVMACMALLMMLLYSPTLAGVAVGGVFLFVLARLAWYRPLYLAREEQIVREAQQSSHLLETLRGVRALKLFGRQSERLGAWQGLLSAELGAGLRVQALNLGSRLSRGIISGGFALIILWLGALEVLAGRLSLGMLLAFIAFRSQFNGRVMDFVERMIETRMLRLDMDRLSDIVLTAPEPSAGAGSHVRSSADLTIRLDKLSFRFADHEPMVLNELSLEIKPGELVAITGPSGCGKSTLLNLLLGDATPVAGSVTVGGRHLDARLLPGWRGVVGTVLQDDTLFAGSIAENISCFDNQPDGARINRCVRDAALTEDIERMPMGLQTLVGDMGTTLSGGQKQRVLLARALYKQPRVLLLDEATSHLDVGRELAVMASLADLSVTRIIVAHRLETLASVDRVIELNAGKLAFDGPVKAWLARRENGRAVALRPHGH